MKYIVLYMIFALQGSLQIKKIYDPSWCLGERQWMVKKSKKKVYRPCVNFYQLEKLEAAKAA